MITAGDQLFLHVDEPEQRWLHIGKRAAIHSFVEYYHDLRLRSPANYDLSAEMGDSQAAIVMPLLRLTEKVSLLVLYENIERIQRISGDLMECAWSGSASDLRMQPVWKLAVRVLISQSVASEALTDAWRLQLKGESNGENLR